MAWGGGVTEPLREHPVRMVSVVELITRLGECLDVAEAGGEVVITRNDVPVAVLRAPWKR